MNNKGFRQATVFCVSVKNLIEISSISQLNVQLICSHTGKGWVQLEKQRDTMPDNDPEQRKI